jgi:hypothetical protein
MVDVTSIAMNATSDALSDDDDQRLSRRAAPVSDPFTIAHVTTRARGSAERDAASRVATRSGATLRKQRVAPLAKA